VRNIRPSVVLRRVVESGAGATARSFWSRLRASPVQIVSVTVIVLSLAGIAAALSNSWKGGMWFAGALAVSLAVLLGLAALLLRVLRFVLGRTRLALPSSVRQGLSNLYRPGNQSAAVLAALGVGVMLILSVFLMQRSIVAHMRSSIATATPNVFLIDISTGELDGLRTLLKAQPGISGELDALPILSARITALNGTPVDQLDGKVFPKHLHRTVSLTWSGKQPDGLRLTEGHWWTSDQAHEFAVLDRIAKRLHLHPGSELTFDSDGHTIVARVAAIYSVDGEHISSRSEFIFAPAQLAGLPVIWYGAVHVAPARIGDMQRALFAAYPTVTVINVADILDTIQSIIGQITIVIRFLAGFSILSGAVILASSVASTRFRRIREVVVLKMLGATRNYIAAVFSVEFLVLGLLAGLTGTVFANALCRILLHIAPEPVDFVSSPGADWIAILATAALAVATGWVASFRILGQKPLEVLREE
jgi:putative ABC transport system permease protein